jgi:hypothetical protein
MKQSIGNFLLRRLQEAGIRHIFGVPGDYNLGFMQQLEDRGVINNSGYTVERAVLGKAPSTTTSLTSDIRSCQTSSLVRRGQRPMWFRRAMNCRKCWSLRIRAWSLSSLSWTSMTRQST